MGFFSKLFGLGAKPDTLVDPTSPNQSYQVAYFGLPKLAYGDMDRVKEIWEKDPDDAGSVAFSTACELLEKEPSPELVEHFKAVKHKVAGVIFHVLIHPDPEPVDFSDLDPMDVMQSDITVNLAPHMSCIAYDPAGDHATVYVLGQAPVGGGTTLRKVTSNGTNHNLGPGPEPKVDYFLDAIWQR